MHNSKECFKCNTRKPLTDFYKHKGMADGYLNKCKECTKKDTKENIEKNKDYYAEYDRKRNQLPHRIEMKKRYIQTEAGKEVARKAKSKWIDSNVIKRSAQIIVRNAVRSGKILKPSTCSECKKESPIIHGHHDDYDYPLVVRWLCPNCHTAWHRKENEY